MDDVMLHPWMLRTEWREYRHPLLIVDLAGWPATVTLGPLPPVPVIAIGARDHPQAMRADLVVEPPVALTKLVERISATPRAAATLVQLLRAIEGLPAEQALPLESFAFAMLQSSGEHTAWLARRRPAVTLPFGRLHIARSGNMLNLLIDRPLARNAIDRTMRDGLYDAFALAALDPDIERVALRATGRSFGVGADLAEFGTTRDPVAAHHIRVRTLPAHAIIRYGGTIDAHIRGGCVGSSLELAAFAGHLTASRDAWFQLPEVAMGILPGFGGCVSVPARIGRQRAAAMMLSGHRLRAQTALDWGLIDAFVDDPPADDRRAHQIG